ncbi:MAG: pilus assembly protein, partial [Burkholderiales bacterium]|nr:pilus assembly protein [Burkholderiales bacterium]
MQCTLKRARVANHRVPRRQRGAAAIEFMLIMAVLLPAFYVGVAFAVTLLAQQMVTQATAEGARAALRGCSLADRENQATQ